MSWSGSAIFTQTMNNPLLQATLGSGTALPTGWVTTGIAANAFKAALYNNTGTPLNTDTLAHIAYNGAGGPWVTANEVTGTNWAAGGVALGTLSYGIDGTATNALAFHAANTSATTATISGAFGCLVYCTGISGGTGVANQGFCYNYFGGSQSVTGGTFTIAWFTTGYSSGTVLSVTT
jgi:hypothetical protein